MKKFWIIQLWSLIVSYGASCWAADKIKICLIEYPPYMSEKLPGYGVEPSIVAAAFKLMDIDIEYNFLPPGRAFLSAKKGSYHAAVGWVWSEERAKSFYYSDSILQGKLVFFHLKSYSFKWESYDDLKDIPIGIVVKNYYGRNFHKALDTGILSVQEVIQDEFNFDKLLVSRIKLFPLNVHIGYYFINSKYNAEVASLFTHHPKPLKVSVYHVLFSKKIQGNKALVKVFNQGLRKLKVNGIYQEIVDKYDLK
ncbi:substrate-binding periplasmic protein [Spartinivicinus ruber]|uniref:substrate-binding periplasmic protein n=1 Tax=Spartinivicinus ruber TaxID=2683272 RepID=UPI0013D3D87A|nr:transporter substrate-binding domain-containing protein [Spartinivicinus ruber]